MRRKVIIPITPQTWVRVTANDSIFFRIPREKLKPSGLKRLLRIEKYNNYKASLFEQSKINRFDIPEQGLCISFFVPVPKSWKKWKKEAMHFKLHQSTPDLSNFLKAFEDALCVQDKYIAHYGELSKYWTNTDFGWIELTFTEARHSTLQLPDTKRNLLKIS